MSLKNFDAMVEEIFVSREICLRRLPQNGIILCTGYGDDRCNLSAARQTISEVIYGISEMHLYPLPKILISDFCSEEGIENILEYAAEGLVFVECPHMNVEEAINVILKDTKHYERNKLSNFIIGGFDHKVIHDTALNDDQTFPVYVDARFEEVTHWLNRHALYADENKKIQITGNVDDENNRIIKASYNKQIKEEDAVKIDAPKLDDITTLNDLTRYEFSKNGVSRVAPRGNYVKYREAVELMSYYEKQIKHLNKIIEDQKTLISR